MRVLIICGLQDTNQLMRLGEDLSKAGHVVTTTTWSLSQILEKKKSKNFDLVLCSLKPQITKGKESDRTGLEYFLDELRKGNPNLKVAICTDEYGDTKLLPKELAREPLRIRTLNINAEQVLKFLAE